MLELRDTLELEGEQLGLYLEEIIEHARGERVQARRRADERGRAGRGRLPDRRGADDRGPSLLRGQQRAAGLRRRRLPALRARGGLAGAPRVGRRPPRLGHVLGVRRARVRRPARARARRAGDRALRAHAARSRARPRRLPADPHASVAVGQPARGHVRGRRRAPTARVPRAGGRRVPGPAIDPDVLQRHRSVPPLRQDGAVGGEHGLRPRACRPGTWRARRRSTTGWPTCSRDDEVLARSGFGILRERAAVGYRSEQYEAAATPASPYPKMLAALWRESPVGMLAPGERLATMASLLHVDRDGRSFAGALIERSGLERGDVAAPLPRRLPQAAAALLLRARPRVHAPRREHHPGARVTTCRSASCSRTSPRRSC